MRYVVPFAFILILLLPGCNKNAATDPASQGSGTIFLWVASDKDTYISCGRTASCEEGDLNFGLHGSLPVAGWELAKKRVYVDFSLPTFPEGTEIQEAYFELYHAGKNEDGKTDDISIPVGMASALWKPQSLTWNNAPEKGPPASTNYSIRLRSQSWSGTANMADIVRSILRDPANFHGFMLWWEQNMNGGLGIEKSFYSNNDIRRTQNDPGKSPRLLLKVHLPDGKTTSDIRLDPYLDPDNDLQSLPRPTTMVLFRSGPDWPADWEPTVTRR